MMAVTKYTRLDELDAALRIHGLPFGFERRGRPVVAWIEFAGRRYYAIDRDALSALERAYELGVRDCVERSDGLEES